MEEKDRHIKGGDKFMFESNFMISISRTPDDGNGKIKVIRSKFTPPDEEKK